MECSFLSRGQPAAGYLSLGDHAGIVTQHEGRGFGCGRAEPREHKCPLGRFARQMGKQKTPVLQAVQHFLFSHLVLPCSKIIPQILLLYTIYLMYFLVSPKSIAGGDLEWILAVTVKGLDSYVFPIY